MSFEAHFRDGGLCRLAANVATPHACAACHPPPFPSLLGCSHVLLRGVQKQRMPASTRGEQKAPPKGIETKGQGAFVVLQNRKEEEEPTAVRMETRGAALGGW